MVQAIRAINSSPPLYADATRRFHDWHLDGGESASRYELVDRMWVMLQHDAVSSRDAADRADATSILIVPANALETYRAHPVLHACTKATLSAEDESLCQECLEGMLDALACPVIVRPGDVLIYRGDIWHRTQDTSHRRLALSLKLQRNLAVQGETHSTG